VSDALARRLGYLRGAAQAPARRAGPAAPGEGWEPAGRWTWRRVERVPADGGADRDVCAFGRPRSRSELLFYDTETTGLSGGAGSLAFLIGFARPAEGAIELEQLFLTDFPGEPEFLDAMSVHLEKRPRTLVSYNGKGFDTHLLRSRFALAGREVAFGEQIDLLHPVRRLWKRRLRECSLTSVSAAVLGMHRAVDIPGAEVPDAYFAYLRHGDRERLSLVFEHNRQDLLAMVGLLERIEGLVAGAVEPGLVDETALGAWLLDRGDERGTALLQRQLEAGETQAGRLLGQHYKRQRDWDRAVGVWERLANLTDAHAAVELAKYAEHRLRNPGRALQWLDAAGPAVARYRRDDVERRRKRLLAKVEQRG
jgi:uncharacterized protein